MQRVLILGALIFDGGKEAIEGVVSALPLVIAKLIDTEIIELRPLPGLGS